ncbi:MAG TPA: DegT/DnrJ/EryC1/StrS family aminotransferase [Pirellulaceae bacterium]|nr:DegT/DnrJ/EryC1/StrS family aminotransferase [Pirellulaceae bacterium]
MTEGSALRSSALPTSVPLLDVGRANRPLKDEFVAAIGRVLDSGRFLHGAEVAQLEHEIARLCGTEHAVACASGSDALLLALMALDIGEGDEVIVPSFTFFATASAVWRLNARPVFVDIDPATFNLDPQCVEEAITPATKAIIPVHLFGQCADMDAIQSIAERRGLWVIEDAAQAIGATYRGRPAGSMGAIGCLSFYPTKNLGAFGDGGMLTTCDEPLAQRLRLLAGHGMSPRYYHKVVGINSRLDTIQAAVLLVKLARLEEWSKVRSQHAARYDQLLRGRGLDLLAGLPGAADNCDHVWNQYTVRIPGGRRDVVKAQLAQAGIGSEIYYPVPLHLQECFRSLGYGPGTLPHTERAAQEVLSLPVFPELTEAEQDLVVERLGELLVGRMAKAA